MLEGATRFGDKPALIDGASGRALTYRQLVDGVGRVASALRRRGLKKGDVFAIVSPNVLEYPIAFRAVASLGGIVTTINSLYTPRELRDQLRDSGARNHHPARGGGCLSPGCGATVSGPARPVCRPPRCARRAR